MSAPAEKLCRKCGRDVPPRTHPGGPPKEYCSEKCGQRERDNRKPTDRGSCHHCPHCQARRAQAAAWVPEAIAELRGGRAALQSRFIAFRQEVEALVESLGLAGGRQGEP